MPQDAGLPESSSSLPFPKGREVAPTAGRPDPAAALRASAEQSAPPGLSATPDFLSLLVALRQRWASAVMIGGTLAALAGVAVWFLLAPKNTAFAHLQVGYTDRTILERVNSSAGDFKNVLATTAAEITTRRVIAAALRRDEVKRLGLDQKEADPAQAIQDDLKYEIKDNSELLTIQYAHHDPAVATTVVNAIKDAYLEDIVPAKRHERANKVKELQKVYDESVEGIRSKKQSLKKIVEDLGTIDPLLWRMQRQELTDKLKELRGEASRVAYSLIEKRAALETLDARIQAYKERASGPVPPADKHVFEAALEDALEKDAEAKQAQARIKHYEDEIEDHIHNRGLRANDYAIVAFRNRAAAARKQLEKRKAALADRVQKALARPATPITPTGEDPAILRAQLQKQVDAIAELDGKYAAEIKTLSAKAAEAPVLGAEYEQRAEEIKLQEENLKTIGFRLEQEKVEMRSAPRISSFQDAELMKKEIKKQVLAAGAAPIAVFGAVCMGLAWLEFRKRRVHSAGEISRGLGIRVVGAVPRMPHLERHLVGPTGESDLEGTPVMESIDAIRTRLLHEANTRSTRVVMVTSAGPGEGKTTLASALATSLARAGRKTLLLDGDLRRPTVHELFEVAMQPGFSEVLLGEIEVAEAAVASPQENLSVIPAGQWDREVLLALARHGLEGVFERLAEEFDFVVIDSHPVLSATDSLLIGRQADAVLLSVLREVSQMPRVYAASQQLTAVGIRVLGAVVNGTSPEEVYTSAPVAAAVA
jgi:capsular exopolysaccharide synthesis family protein